MRVEGIGAGQAPALKTGAQAVDAVSKSLQKQIENAQKQMQDLAKNEQMSPEDKMKKRQELQKQISDLNQQLRQHEVELRRKQAQEARQKREREAQESELDKQEREQRGGFSKDRMNAMLSADSAMKQADIGDGVITSLKGEKNVLASEIKMDRSRGVNTAKKEEKLSDLEKRMDDVRGTQIQTLAEANKKLDEATEKENDERTKDQKAKDDEPVDQTGELNLGFANGMPEDDATMAEEIAQKMEKEQEPGQIIDKRL